MESVEIARFTSGGKTFFFNECEAANGNKFLGINTLWGENNQERLVLFPEQMLTFGQKFDRAMEAITGYSPSQPISKLLECPDCNAPKKDWNTRSTDEAWFLACGECGWVILTSHKDNSEAVHLVEEENEND